MKSLTSIVLLAATIGVVTSELQPVSTSAVGLIGGVIKSRHSVNSDAKYQRKDCPVCKGSGWYISGDKITKVDCGYCEEDKKKESIPEEVPEEVDIVLPDVSEEIEEEQCEEPGPEEVKNDTVDNPKLVPIPESRRGFIFRRR